MMGKGFDMADIVEAEHEPDWNDFEYDEETGEYVLREDLDLR